MTNRANSVQRRLFQLSIRQRISPWILAFIISCICLAAILGTSQRITDGFVDGIEQAKHHSSKISVMMSDMMRVRYRSITQATSALERSDEHNINAMFWDKFGMGSLASAVVWSNDQGIIEHTSVTGLLKKEVPLTWINTVRGNSVQPQILELSTEYSSFGIPLGVQARIGERTGVFIVFLPKSHFTEGTRMLLDGRTGYIQIQHTNGTPFLTSDGTILIEDVKKQIEIKEQILLGSIPENSVKNEYTSFIGRAAIDDVSKLKIVAGLMYEEAMRATTLRKGKTWAMVIPIAIVIMGLMLWAVYLMFQANKKEIELRKLVALDPLTSLPNRRSFNEILQREMQHVDTGKLTGLMFLDLDNFKYVNDTYGHEVGDKLLRKVSQLLLEEVRSEDIVSRLGGDEFTIILPNLVRSEDAMIIAQRIIDKISQNVSIDDLSLTTGVSIGVAFGPQDAAMPTHLVRCADMALYQAKDKGKHCASRFTKDLLERNLERTRLSAELDNAILSNNGELYLVYQPKFNLEQGSLAGYEALLRWNHPTHGAIPPTKFVNIAEESELVVRLGDWVVMTGIQQLAKWHQEENVWRQLALNVSARQLRDQHIVATIQQYLAKYHVPGHAIQLELTETMLSTDVEGVAKTLQRLRDLGITIAVDDFGTGYSSLTTLQQLDVQYIKIDRSFVQGIADNKDSMEICRAIITMAKSMDLRIVAEGIETEEQRQCLLQLGCHEGQGFLLGKPMPASFWTPH